jgi:murein DD-endopeptidase MepM/ murein hydrolase activator NlpD
MKRDLFSRFFPGTAVLGLILVKLFIGLITILTGLILFVLPAASGKMNISSAGNNFAVLENSTISPEDAAVANSEWSGAITQKTFSSAELPIILPTRIPTILPVNNTAPSTANNSQSRPVNVPNSQIGSPLEGFGVGDLKELVSQEFKDPPPGEDTGHHGVDFAFWNRGNKPILGDPILSVFPGKVAMANSQEKPPYGNVLIIETPFTSVPQSLIQSIKIPTQPIGTTINNKLNCPDLSTDKWNSTSKSLYTLYAHMISAPIVKPGEDIQLGQTVGYVGNSGYSSAPHLHLEMRIGPSGATFSSMGHYDPITTEEDRHNYCNWRVSGVFQMFDPMDLFTASLALK